MKKNIYTVLIIFLMLVSNLSSKIKEYYIECNPDDFKRIYENFLEDIHIPIKISYNNQHWSDTKMRIRGETTRYGPKKSLKIQFSGEPFYNGKTTINLNSDYQDKSYLHSVLASKIFNEVGVPCFEAEHVSVFLNGEYLGLYVQIENMDEQFLEKFGFQKSGNLYKASKDGACLSIYDNIDSLWEKKTNENTDRSDLKSLIELLNYTPDSLYYQTCKSIFDYDNLISFLSLNMLLANASTYYHNYYLFNDISTSEKWFCFPWDMDKTFNNYNSWWHYSASGSWAIPANPILERALLDSLMFADIKKKLYSINTSFFNLQKLNPIIDSLVSVIQNSVADDTTDNIKDDLIEWNEWVSYTKNFIRDRLNALIWQFNNYPLPFKMNATENVYIKNPTFSWNKSISPLNKEITYNLYIGKTAIESSTSTIKIESIKDTFYTPTNLDYGVYYVKVEASDGTNIQEAFDRYNKFEYKKGTALPCEINEDLVLKKEDSPYIANCSVVVKSGIKLNIEPGVIIFIDGNHNFEIYGEIEAIGSKIEPIIFKPAPGNSKFRELYMKNPSGICTFKNVEFHNCNIKALNGVYYFDKINIYINDTTIIDDAIFAEYAKINIQNSKLFLHGNIEGIIVFLSENPITQNCYVDKASDAYEYVLCNNGVFDGNTSINAMDDGIDQNCCKNTIVKENVIINSKDKGFSIGNDGYGISEKIQVIRNLLIGNDIGIQINSGSTAVLENNTIVNNRIAIHGYDKVNYGAGGIAQIKNNILYNNNYDVIALDNSVFNISYNLSNKSLISGIANIFDDPLFINSDLENYNLLPDSKCIDAGDPSSIPDPDGTRTDIGVFYYDQRTPKIVINEINYNSSINSDSEDWVEFYNNEQNDVDISNWIFKDSEDSHSYVFPNNTMIKKGGYLVLCFDTTKFNSIFKNIINKYGNMSFGLSGSGEKLRLYDNFNKLIDFVEYDDIAPWDELADGKGHSLELIDPNNDNANAKNWKASIFFGTPDRINDNFSNYKEDSIGSQFEIKKVYPNPAKDYILVEILTSDIEDLELKLIDMNGKKIIPDYSFLKYSDNELSIYLNLERLSNGLYHLSINNLKKRTHAYFLKLL